MEDDKISAKLLKSCSHCVGVPLSYSLINHLLKEPSQNSLVLQKLNIHLKKVKNPVSTTSDPFCYRHNFPEYLKSYVQTSN